MNKLLIISNRGPDETGGRPEKLAARAEYLRESNWKVDFVKVTPTFPGIATGVARVLSALRTQEVDVVLSMCNPPHLHAVGLAVGRLSPVPWVAEFRDPLVTIPSVETESFQARYRAWLESLVVRTADQVIWPDGIQLRDDYFQTQYGERYDRNWYKLPFMGYRKDQFDNAGTRSFDQFTITYAGSFYEGWIEPHSFLSGFQQFIEDRDLSPEDIRFRAYGDWNESYEESVTEHGLNEFVDTSEFIPYEKLVPILKGSDALLYVGGDDPRNQLNVPTKIWDYIGAGNPMLGVVDPGFRVASFIKEHRVGIVADYSDPTAIRDGIATLYDEDFGIDQETARDRFTRDRHSKAFENVIEHVAAGTRKVGTWHDQ